MFFSVIIPTYNRPKQVSACLASLNHQELNRNEWEVIVVDDGSKDDIEGLIRSLSLNYSWRYLYQRNSGPGEARNTGAAIAEGKYLAFLDDDCEADEFWLLNLQKKMKPKTLFGGKTVNKLRDNIFSETSQLLVTYLYETLTDTHLMFFTSNNFAVDKETFIGCGGFNTNFMLAAGEDREFSIRYNHMGHSLEFVDDALILHSHWLTFSSFLRQHFNYGRSSYLFRIIMKRQGIDLSIDDTYFFLRLLFYPFYKDIYSFRKKTSIVYLLGMTQFSYLLGYLWELLTGRKIS